MNIGHRAIRVLPHTIKQLVRVKLSVCVTVHDLDVHVDGTTIHI
jgi:hypothetical protein